MAHQEDQSLLSLLARRWRTVGVTFLVTAGVAGFALSCLPPRYEATSKLLIMKTEQRMGGVKVVEEVLPELSHTSNPLFTQVELLRVMPVFEEVIRTIGLVGANGELLAPQALAERVKVTPIDKTDLIAISYVASDPRQAQQVVEAIGETYLRYAEQYRMEGVRDGFKLVDQQLETAEKRMLDADNQLLAFKRQTGSVAITEEIHSSVAALAGLNSEIRDRQIDLARARARASSLERQLGMDAQQALRAAAVAQSPKIRALQQQLVEAESSPLRAQGLGGDHPEVVALNQRITQLKAAIADDIRSIGGKGGAPLDEVRMGMIRELAAAEVEVNANQAALAAAESRRRSLVAGQSILPDQEARLTRLSRETKVASEIYQQLLEKREGARLNMAMAPAYVRIIEPANLPEQPLPPLRGLGLPFVLLGSLTSALGLGALRDLLDRKPTPQAVASSLPDLKLFSALPHLTRHERGEGELIMRTNTSPAYVEAVRTLAYAVDERLQGAEHHVLGLTSTSAQEGKSVTLANIALALADAGKRVLIVDVDLRRPRLHEVFRIRGARPGLTDVLMGRAQPLDIVQACQGVDVVTAGTIPIKSGHMKLPHRLAPALGVWREHYDVVLLDLPPLVVMSEVLQVGKLTDGMLMLGNLQEVTTETLAGGIHQLQAFKVPLLGVAVICKMIGTAKRGYYLIAGEGLVQ